MFLTYWIAIALFWAAGLVIWQSIYSPEKGNK